MAATTSYGAFTDDFEVLRDELLNRSLTLSNSTDKIEIKQKKLCDQAIVLIDKPSKSLAVAIKTAKKVATKVIKAFPNEFTIVNAGGITFTNNMLNLLLDTYYALGTDVQAEIVTLGGLINALPDSPDKLKAAAQFDAATNLLALAQNSLTFAQGSALLGKSLKAALKGQTIANNSGGGGFGNNSVTMKVNGSSWKALVAGAVYDTSTGEFDLDGVRKNPDSVLTLVVSSGVTGPGTYALPAGMSFYITKTQVYQNTGGTLTITTLDEAGEKATGTFSFTGNPVGGGSPVTITNGAFTINDLTVW